MSTWLNIVKTEDCGQNTVRQNKPLSLKKKKNLVLIPLMCFCQRTFTVCDDCDHNIGSFGTTDPNTDRTQTRGRGLAALNEYPKSTPRCRGDSRPQRRKAAIVNIHDAEGVWKLPSAAVEGRTAARGSSQVGDAPCQVWKNGCFDVCTLDVWSFNKAISRTVFQLERRLLMCSFLGHLPPDAFLVFSGLKLLITTKGSMGVFYKKSACVIPYICMND